MKKILLACAFLICCYSKVFSQNKTLGVGIPAPNPNAALHVESPTGNQGFIMPRLTTVQREAMSALLGAADKGLMLYDISLNTMFIWDGVMWKSSSQVAGGPQLVYPYVDTVATSPGADTVLFKLLYQGAATEKIGVARFENQNPNNNQHTLNVSTNGFGAAGRFRINNTKSKMPVVWAETNSDSAYSAPIYGLNTGKGDVAGSFRLTNTGNGFPAIYAETNGTGRVATFVKLGTSGQPAVFANVKATGHGFWSEHEGTNGYAAILQSVNASNPSPAVFVEALGSGFSLFVQKSQPTSTGHAIYSEHLGTSGTAARFVINNAENTSPAIIAVTNGAGPAVSGENTSATNGFAGHFNNTNAANAFPAIQASTAGNGSGVRVMQTTGTGAGMDVFMQNTASNAPGVAVDQRGLGNGGSFNVNNAANGSPALVTRTSGTGAAFEATTATGFTAIYGRREGATNGNAGLFDIIDAANTYPAVQVNTAGSGSALNAVTTGTGSAGTFNNNNGSSSAAALYAQTQGTGAAIQAQTATGASAIYARQDGSTSGNAGAFEIGNATNSSAALQGITAGTGYAIHALHNGSSGDAFYAERAGTGSGSAGNFRIQDANNTASAVYASTTAADGAAIGARNDANGVAFAIWNGGMQITTADVTTSSITTRASAYHVTAGGTNFTLDFAPKAGEVFMIFNGTAQNITVAGFTILPNEGKTFVVFNGGIKGF